MLITKGEKSMSKCTPTPTTGLQALECAGVKMIDTTTKSRGETNHFVTIQIPYEALRDNKEVQIAFQDLVYIATSEPNDKN